MFTCGLGTVEASMLYRDVMYMARAWLMRFHYVLMNIDVPRTHAASTSP